MNGLAQSLIQLFDRDLSKLEAEIKLYEGDPFLWKVAGEIKNSGGNLCLHICGNLRHFVGNVLGNTGYVRNREYEFEATDVSREDMIAEIQETKSDLRLTLEKLDTTQLDREYPLQVLGHPMTTTFFLIHLNSHLMYHLGQINYHRRLVKNFK